MLKCTDTNNANTLLTCFLEAVSTYGLPSRVQADQGLENVKIADYMISRGGINRGSAITGKSTHSQRTECFCKDVVVLHHVFLHKIQEKLDMWNRVWSQHRLRTARSSPTRMWVAGQLKTPLGIELESEAICSYGVEGFINEEAGDGSLKRPMFLKGLHIVPQYSYDS